MKTDRERLVGLIKKANLSMWGKSGLSSAAARNEHLSDYLVSNGAVIPIRCKDCKNYVHIIGRGENEIKGCQFMGRNIEANDFCSYGERKDQ